MFCMFFATMYFAAIPHTVCCKYGYTVYTDGRQWVSYAVDGLYMEFGVH